MSSNQKDRSVYFNETIASNETSCNQTGGRYYSPLGKSKSEYLITNMQDRSVYLTEPSNENTAHTQNPSQHYPNQIDQRCEKEAELPKTTIGCKPHNEQKVKRPKTRRKMRAEMSAADEAAVVEKKENEESTPKKNPAHVKMVSEIAHVHQNKPEEKEKKTPKGRRSNRPTRDNKETKQHGHFDKTMFQDKETPKNKK